MLKEILVVLCFALLDVHALTCSFESNVDYFGNDLGTQPCYVKTLDECCALCNQVTQCAAWTFLPSTGACWLKYTITERRICSDGRFSGCRQQPVQPQPTCTEKQNINYPGCDLKEVGNVKTSAECCNICRQTSGCAAFAFYSQYEYCYLKSAKENGTPEEYPGMTYGFF